MLRAHIRQGHSRPLPAAPGRCTCQRLRCCACPCLPDCGGKGHARLQHGRHQLVPVFLQAAESHKRAWMGMRAGFGKGGFRQGERA